MYAHSPIETHNRELVRRFRNSHNESYVAEIFLKYSPYINSICLHYLNTVEAAEKAAISVFDQLKNELKRHEIDNLNEWLFLATRSECLSFLRNTSSNNISEKVTKLNGSAFLELRKEFGLTDSENKKTIIRLMMRGLQWLKKEERICIEHVYLDKMNEKEVSHYTGLSLSQVELFLRTGKRNLKTFLERQHEIAD